jgi:hypothetical protein
MFYLTEEVHCKVRYSCEVESGMQSFSVSDSRDRRRGISELFCYRGSAMVASNQYPPRNENYVSLHRDEETKNLTFKTDTDDSAAVWRPEISDDALAPLDQKKTTEDAEKQKRD